MNRTGALVNPVPLYAKLRAEGPAHWNERAGAWIVVGHDLARAVLRDDRFRMPTPPPDSPWTRDQGLRDFIRGMMLEAEGDEHTRLRRAVAGVFTPRALRARTATITATLHDILDDIARSSIVDGVTAIAGRFPVAVVGDLIGIPPAQRAEVSELCRRISGGGGLANPRPTEDDVRASVAGIGELRDHVRRWLAEPALRRPDTVLGRIAASGLTEPEAVATVLSIYVAGHDTSRNLLSALLLRVAANAALLPALAAGTVAAAAIVDRVLLVDVPLTFTARVATCDVDIAGLAVGAGDQVRVLLGAANHDLVTTNATDGPLHGLAFGDGRHVCLGAQVAHLEGTTLLDVLARRWGSVRLAGAVEWFPNFLLRGLTAIPMEVTWCTPAR